jgi:peptidoglycan/LPS O-acetylase OafA/YrhL
MNYSAEARTISDDSSLSIAMAGGPEPAVDATRLSKYFPAIDGLLAWAVFGVILFHLHLWGMALGWAGVWLFYVISGFLITGILLDAKSRPHYFRNFYARRTLPIFPIYYLLLILICVAAAYNGTTVRDVGYYVFYIQNRPLGSTQFKPAFPITYNHTWTLAVEEQFYLLCPLIVRFLSASLLPWLCVALIFVAPLARACILHFTHNQSVSLTPLICNVDALGVGGILAIWIRGNRLGMAKAAASLKIKHGLEILSLAILVIILSIVLSYGHRAYWNSTDSMPSVNVNIVFATVLSLWFASLVFYVAVWDSWLRRILSHRLLVHPGRISYGIYLFHYPVLTYSGSWLRAVNPHLGNSRIVLVLVTLLVSYMLALASWRFLETRFLRLKRQFA